MFIPILQTVAPIATDSISANNLDSTIRVVGAIFGAGLLFVALLNFWLRWRKSGLEMELLRAKIAEITTSEARSSNPQSFTNFASHGFKTRDQILQEKIDALRPEAKLITVKTSWYGLLQSLNRWGTRATSFFSPIMRPVLIIIVVTLGVILGILFADLISGMSAE